MARKARRLSTLASLIAAIVWPSANVLAQTPLSPGAVERRPTVQATLRKQAPPIRQ